jgi:GlpG protein
MRSIGRFTSEAQARIFSDFLWVQGIQNELEHAEGEGEWILWVHSDDQLEEAREQLTAFLANPEAQEYARAAQEAQQLKAEERQKRDRAQKINVNIRKTWNRGMSFGIAPLTLALIITSVAVTLITRQGRSEEFAPFFYITMYRPPLVLPEIQSGQIWRLISPIFVHLGILHILFNMLWLKDLGTAIERLQGPWKLALLVGVIGVVSNLGQYFFMPDTLFGGMSGVVYGLLGYIWLRGKFDPTSGYFMDKRILIFMGAWFAICLFSDRVANTAHAVGLVTGLAWGYLSAQWARFQRKGS